MNFNDKCLVDVLSKVVVAVRVQSIILCGDVVKAFFVRFCDNIPDATVLRSGKGNEVINNVKILLSHFFLGFTNELYHSSLWIAIPVFLRFVLISIISSTIFDVRQFMPILWITHNTAVSFLVKVYQIIGFLFHRDLNGAILLVNKIHPTFQIGVFALPVDIIVQSRHIGVAQACFRS
jgi:hypothetical protein